MNEYIEKNALYKKIAELEELARNRYLDTPSNSPACARYMAQLDERTRFKHMIYDSPAADVVPVVRGKWRWKSTIESGEDCYICFCSCCGKECGNYYDDEDDMIYYIRQNYCPNCGAKMDLED